MEVIAGFGLGLLRGQDYGFTIGSIAETLCSGNGPPSSRVAQYRKRKRYLIRSRWAENSKMTTHSLLKLAEVGSSPIVATFNERLFDQELTGVGHRHELKNLLGLKNGFYAFESSLHVFPFVLDNWFNHQDLHHWNLPELWKRAYTDTLDRMCAFAEDVFGYQFCSLDQKIVRFDPETGETEDLCSSLDEWAAVVLKDYNLQTGYPVAHAWQTQNGPLKRGNRLVPIYPLISKEGSYEIGNFYEVDALKGLLSRADFARQIKNIGDGESVKITPINVD